MRFLALASLLVLSVCSAQGGLISLSGDTTGMPVWNRPLGDPPVDLSPTGTAVPYQTVPFWVDTSGLYTMEITAFTGIDSYLVLYQDSFDPSDPLAHALRTNDDDGVDNLSRLSHTLAPGVDYFAVVTGYGNLNFGAWTMQISGPGDISNSAVPEPFTMSLMGLGLMALLVRSRFVRR